MSLLRVMVLRCDGCGKMIQAPNGMDARYSARRFRDWLRGEGWSVRSGNGQGSPELCPECRVKPDLFRVVKEAQS